MSVTSVLSILCSGLALIPSAYETYIPLTNSWVCSRWPCCLCGLQLSFSLFWKAVWLVRIYCRPIFVFAIRSFSNFDPDFYFINVGFLIACVLTLVHPAAIYIRIKRCNSTFAIVRSQDGVSSPSFRSGEELPFKA